ncbi:BEN domain-containing protein 5-like [Haemaphysalis longicornis]
MEDPFQQGQDVYMPKQTQEGASTAEAQDVQVPRPAEQEGAAVSTLQRREGELPSHSSAVPCPAQDFSYLANGSFHLSKGVVISAVQAKKILANKKPTLVCKDTAHAIWGPEELAKRSVSGIVAPRKKHSGELPKKALSPGKVDVIKATLEYWARSSEWPDEREQQKQLATKQAIRNIEKILGEKIQDVVKATRKMKTATAAVAK